MDEATATAGDHVVTRGGTPDVGLAGEPRPAVAVPVLPRTVDEAVAGAISALNDVSVVADNTLAELSARIRREAADARERGWREGFQEAIERAATMLGGYPAARRIVLGLADRRDGGAR